MSKLPGDGNLLTLAAAVAIVAVVGAVVALPALRLSGIYLALSTAAFAVLVTKLVFNQRQTFQTGNIDVPVLNLPLITIDSPRGRLILAACAFSLLGLGVVALRRSRLGRQLIALKDSPAAAATLGMSLTRAKVLAFAISAGIAAFAGALAGDKVSPQQFDFMQSLPTFSWPWSVEWGLSREHCSAASCWAGTRCWPPWSPRSGIGPRSGRVSSA
ncbi:MAG: branched-chain amino acid ABC transporter permease [Actinomycetota bacterium]